MKENIRFHTFKISLNELIFLYKSLYVFFAPGKGAWALRFSSQVGALGKCAPSVVRIRNVVATKIAEKWRYAGKVTMPL